MKYLILIIWVGLIPQNVISQTNEELILDYAIDVTKLNTTQSARVDSFISVIADSTELLKLHIVGSADYLGSIEYNQKISDRRVAGVQEYIMKAYPELIDSIHTRSEGELDNKGYEDEGGGVQKHRTVTIKVIKNKESDAIEALDEAASGEKIIFRNLNFQPGRHYLLKRSIPELQRLLQLLIDNPTLVIEIHGHICCVDPDNQPEGLDIDTNKFELSINRAKNIYEYLIKKGIDPERLSYKGFGSSQKLVFPEITADDKTQNRRVEIMVVSK